MVEEGVVAIRDTRRVLVQAGDEYLIDPRSAQLQPAPVFSANGWVSGVLVARRRCACRISCKNWRAIAPWLVAV